MTPAQAMAATLIEIEQDLVRFATAFRKYGDLLEAESRSAYNSNRPGRVQEKLQELLGERVLAARLVRRMRGLGLQLILDAARTTGVMGEDWVSEFGAKVRAHIPEQW